LATRSTRGVGYDYRVVQLARSLGLPGRGDCLPQLRRHALAKIDEIVAQWPDPIPSLDALLQIVAARLSVCLEYIRTDADVERIARARTAYTSQLATVLHCEFVRGTSEGLLIEHEDPKPGDRRYLVVVDARGERAVRAYFTAWHEISHVLTTPPQLEFKLFRRTPAADEVRKDPVESAVDHVAGVIAFYEPIFGPVLESEVEREGYVNFSSVERARDVLAAEASTFAAAMAAVRLRPEPLCFVRAEPRLKPAEIRKLRSTQGELGLGLRSKPITPKLRLVDVVMNDEARRSGLRLHEHLRVPVGSVIARVHRDLSDGEYDAREDQAAWETTSDGSLPPMPLRVTAARRGGSVYALISPW
jgi:hypothetical protein